jgi:hypothetical protein
MRVVLHEAMQACPPAAAVPRRGQLSQRIYELMRESGSVSSWTVAAAMMRGKGLDPDSDRMPVPTSRAEWRCRAEEAGGSFEYLVRES